MHEHLHAYTYIYIHVHACTYIYIHTYRPVLNQQDDHPVRTAMDRMIRNFNENKFKNPEDVESKNRKPEMYRMIKG